MIFFNRYFDKNRLKTLVLWNLTRSGEKTTIDLVEKLKDLGFQYATKAGLSLSIDDLKIPPTKPKLILEAEVTIASSKREYDIGNVTSIEKFQQMIDIWHRTSEVLKQNVIQHFRSTDILNPVYMMAFSGARGNISQVRQLVGMRGLMADPQGQILDFPIRSNFREGLTLTEYVISCYGARKGLVDTALRTANSGYLTRRLVDVAQHIIVRQFDCRTNTGILVTEMKDGKKTILSLQKRLVGRVLAESIEPIALQNQDISPALAAKIAKLKSHILVRSPLTCEAKNSICQLCYGWSLAHGNLVSLGEAVGVLAAQSIGEPGTQLTMRTFHTGGVFSGDVMQEIRSPSNGYVYFNTPLQGALIRTLHGKIAFLSKIEGSFSVNQTKNSTSSAISYQIPKSTILFVRNLEHVENRQLLAEFSSVLNVSQGIQAKYNLNSEKEGQIYFENVLLVIKASKEGDIIKTALKFGSFWILAGKLYQSPIKSNLFVKSGDLIDNSSILNESILLTPYNGILNPILEKQEKPLFVSKQIENNNQFHYSQNQFSVLEELLNGKKSISHYPKNRFWQKKSKNIGIKLEQPVMQITSTNLIYKKFGYFLILDSLANQILFFPTSINQISNNVNDFAFQLLDRKFLKKNEITYFINEKNKDQTGQFFLYKKTLFEISNQLNKIYFEKENYYNTKLIFLNSNEILFYKKNLQNQKQKVYFNRKQFVSIKVTILQDKPGQKQKLKKEIQNKKVFVYRENPFLTTKFNSKKLTENSNGTRKKQSFLYSKNLFLYKNKTFFSRKKDFYKEITLPVSFFKKESVIRNKKNPNFVYDFQGIYNNHYTQYLKNQIQIENFNQKIIRLNYNLDSGWISFPKAKLNYLIVQKSFSQPGNQNRFFNFDQIFLLTKYIEFRKKIYFFQKNPSFSKIRFIKNKAFQKKNFQEYYSLTKDLNQTKKPTSREKILRNTIYLKTLYFRPGFLLLTTKAIENNFSNKVKKKILLQTFSNWVHSLIFYKNNCFLLNKQKSTRIKPVVASLDIQVNFLSKKSAVFVKIVKNNQFKEFQFELLFPLNLKISLIRKINTTNFRIPKILSGEKLLLTKEKQVFEQNSLSFNSFFTPYTGEIMSTQTDKIGKQKSLLLTNQDKISFFISNEMVVKKIGQLVRYGDPITSGTAIKESGQIIQINKKIITLRKAQPILFSSQGVFHVDNGDLIENNTPLITLFYQKLKTEDIVQGIPKIEELFEARQTKEGESLQENLHTKLHFFFTYYKEQFTSQYAAKKSIEKIQQILVNNVQKVYQSQGVTIADKHIEIIVRQMTTKVKITESGRAPMLRGELIDLEKVKVINLGIEAQNQTLNQDLEAEKAEYEPVILGITKAALETESFISASSFQETTRILSRAAIERKTDFLRGLKENVILGHLIPAGTGFKLAFDPQFKLDKNNNKPARKKLSWLSYTDIIKIFSN